MAGICDLGVGAKSLSFERGGPVAAPFCVAKWNWIGKAQRGS